MSELARVVHSVVMGPAVTGLTLATQLVPEIANGVPTFSHEHP